MLLRGDSRMSETSFVRRSRPRAARPWTHRLEGSEANNVIVCVVSHKGTGTAGNTVDS